MRIVVEQLCVSEQRGDVKYPVGRVEVDELGIVGDAHRGPWHRQISLLAKESADGFNRTHGTDFDYHLFAANMVLSGLQPEKLALFDKIRINDVLLEVTQIGKKPHPYNSPVYRQTGTNVLFDAGVFCRVLTAGVVENGYIGEVLSTPFAASIITLSDRASSGIYEDKSGPAIERSLQEYFDERRFVLSLEREVLPDDREMLRVALKKRIEAGVYAVFTTGGTGLGPRDITPDVVRELNGKEIPGVMEMIRTKYGQRIPSALLSRSVAVLVDRTIIFTLPGSVQAVEEYMSEIIPLLEHAVVMVRGVGH